MCAGLFWLNKGQSNLVSGARSTSGLLFFEMMFMSMRAMLSALFTFPPNFKIMVKERSSGMYRYSPERLCVCVCVCVCVHLCLHACLCCHLQHGHSPWTLPMLSAAALAALGRGLMG